MSETTEDINAKDNYAGFAQCGCMKIIVSGQMEKRELSKEVAKIVRKGFRLEMVSTAFVRTESRMFCDTCSPPREKKVRANKQQTMLL